MKHQLLKKQPRSELRTQNTSGKKAFSIVPIIFGAIFIVPSLVAASGDFPTTGLSSINTYKFSENSETKLPIINTVIKNAEASPQKKINLLDVANPTPGTSGVVPEMNLDNKHETQSNEAPAIYKVTPETKEAAGLNT